ncbi:MAG: glutamate decarboxylase [Bacteroidetes bacterium]|nr:glutamate decarboxylase [Bacteroidota bacterium]
MLDHHLLDPIIEKIKNYLIDSQKDDLKVVNFHTPGELKEHINFTIPDQGIGEHEFLELIDKYLEFGVKTGNKQFLNQLYSGFNQPAFFGEVFTALTNTSMYTYEVAPVATSIETEMIRLMCSYAGYDNGNGIFLSGGSNANMIAMFSARNRMIPESRLEGYSKDEKLTAFVNERAHYSIETAANILGIGSKQVIKVKTDEHGMIIPEELQKEIKNSFERGEKPFFVVATCATTLLGAYDPIDKMAEITEKYGIWLHADGAFGGSLILSDQHRHLMNGIERTDSFSWNPHKLMNIPLICSTLLVKEKGVLQKNITDIDADYIFHNIDAIEDLGKKSIQCGRRVDAVKLWFAWKYFGIDGYQKRIDNLIDMSEYAEEIIKNSNELEMVSKRQSFALCFRYLPPNGQDLNEFNLQLREKLRKSGKSIVNFGHLGNTLTIRLVITNGEMSKVDVSRFFNNVLEVGKDLDCKGS